MVRSLLLRGITCLVLALPVLVVLAQLLRLVHAGGVSTLTMTFQVSHAAGVPGSVEQQGQGSGMSVLGGPSLSPLFVNQVLRSSGSPAEGTGQALYDLSVQFQIDDAYALAVFQEESSFGMFGAGHVNHALGNIVCAGYSTCHGRFRSYPSWEVGYADFYQLLVREYIPRGLTTVESITRVYAPSSENDTALYSRRVCVLMSTFRQAAHVG